MAGLTVITTASRPETVEWCKQQGADFVVNHKDLVNEVKKAGFQEVDFIVDFVNAEFYWDSFVELIKPQGHIASIADLTNPVDLMKLKAKSVTFSWESMFTRSRFQTSDMVRQHNILNEISNLIDKSVIKTTLNKLLIGMTPDNFKEAHQLLESGKAIGKIAIKF